MSFQQTAPTTPQQPRPPLLPQTTNAWAVAASMLASMGIAPLAIICGHRALAEIKVTGEGGRKFAVSALVLSYTILIFVLGFFALGVIALFRLLADPAGSGQIQSVLEMLMLTLNPAAALDPNTLLGTAPIPAVTAP